MASDDPFMKAAEGRFPLSENPGAARYWTADGVPRPDRDYWWLTGISVLFGGLGADHFWLRSPKTGFLKMLTFGGFGLWWLWDVVQLLTEKERILNYGMTTPFDIATGIAQGMITDKATNYKSKVNYGLWAWSTIFGFLGFDSLFVMKNMGQGLRKLMEGGLVLASLGIFLGFAIGGLPHSFFGWISAVFQVAFAVTCLTLFGTSVGVTWTKTISKAMGTPENLMQEGIVFSDLDDKQVNATVTSMLLATAGNGLNRDENLKTIKEQIKMLKYGSILPQEFRNMFSVQHISEMKPDPLPSSEINSNETNPTAAVATYALAPLTIAGNNVRDTAVAAVEVVGAAAIPGAGAIKVIMNTGANIIKKQAENPAIQRALTDGVVGMLPGSMGKIVGAVLNPQAAAKDLMASATGAVQGAVGQLQSTVTGAAQGAVSKPKAQGAVAQAQGAVGQLQSTVTGAAQGAVGQLQSTVTGAAAGARNAVTQTQGAVAQVAQGGSKDPLGVRNLANIPSVPLEKAGVQKGGARAEPLSLEGKLMGAATIALIGGGAVKFIIDNLMPE